MNRKKEFAQSPTGLPGYSNPHPFEPAPIKNTGKIYKNLFLTLALLLLTVMSSCLMPELSPELYVGTLSIENAGEVNIPGAGNLNGEEYLRILKDPRNIIYYTGDTDPGLTHWEGTGLEVTLIGKDSTEKTVALAECAFTPVDMTEVGTKVITVTRDGKTAVFSIAVLDRASVFQRIMITHVPDITTYLRNAAADWTGLEVIEVIYGGDPQYPPVINKFTYNSPELSFSHPHNTPLSDAPGVKRITVTKGDKSAYFDVTIADPLLSGAVTINGNPRVGQILAANTDALDGTGSPVFQWKRDGEAIPSADGQTYAAQPEDIGKTITVTVSRPGYSGSISGGPTVPVVTVYIATEPITGATITATVGSDVFISGRPVHLASYRIAKYETTYEVWKEVYDWATDVARGTKGYVFANSGYEGHEPAGTTPGTGTTNESLGWTADQKKIRPVTWINWRDAIVWCNACSEISGKEPVYYTDDSYNIVLRISTNDAGYGTAADTARVKPDANGFRLPTEAEWEAAARGGRQSDTTNWAYTYAGSDTAGAVAWYWYNSFDLGGSNRNYGIHPVGEKLQNGAGLFDMSGNAWEWCWDWYEVITSATPPDGAALGPYRILRGGSWGYNDHYLESAKRFHYTPASPAMNIGFRIVRP